MTSLIIHCQCRGGKLGGLRVICIMIEVIELTTRAQRGINSSISGNIIWGRGGNVKYVLSVMLAALFYGVILRRRASWRLKMQAAYNKGDICQ